MERRRDSRASLRSRSSGTAISGVNYASGAMAAVPNPKSAFFPLMAQAQHASSLPRRHAALWRLQHRLHPQGALRTGLPERLRFNETAFTARSRGRGKDSPSGGPPVIGGEQAEEDDPLPISANSQSASKSGGKDPPARLILAGVHTEARVHVRQSRSRLRLSGGG